MKKINILIVTILLFIILFSILNLQNYIGKTDIEIAKNSEKKQKALIKQASDLKECSPNDSDLEIMKNNTIYLQSLIDEVSDLGGGSVYIPAGTYYFASAGKNSRGYEDYCIMCRDNVLVEGAGENTILKPYGTPDNGLDMFYFNDIKDTKIENWLTNMDFKNFVIDGEYAKGKVYNSSGKGFMINLFKDCDWENIIVKNTDATGFGMDCPINCTVKNCQAIGCGKNATQSDGGASGFGIGTGYSNNESILISDCVAIENKKFGFFFEHQNRFDNIYKATKSDGFVVSNCIASGNMYDFGGERANDVTYENCISYNPTNSYVNKAVFYFGNNSRRIHITNSISDREFSDVMDSSQYYYTPVYWGLNNGIVSGVSETNFGTEQKTTRLEAIIFLYRMAGRPGEVATSNVIETGFSDIS